MLPGVCLMTRSRREFWWDESKEWCDGSGSSSYGSEGTLGQKDPEEAGCGVSEGGGDGAEERGSREDAKGMVEVGLWTTDLTNGHEWLLGLVRSGRDRRTPSWGSALPGACWERLERRWGENGEGWRGFEPRISRVDTNGHEWSLAGGARRSFGERGGYGASRSRACWEGA